MGGYQQMVSVDILRARYRESVDTPKAIPAGVPLPYRFAMPTANNVFLPRLPDNGPDLIKLRPRSTTATQTFVPSIFRAPPGQRPFRRTASERGEVTPVDGFCPMCPHAPPCAGQYSAHRECDRWTWVRRSADQACPLAAAAGR